MVEPHDPNPDFVRAVSLIAALEGACKSSDALETLPYLGLARVELTDYGQRIPTHFEDTPVQSFDQSLVLLDRLLREHLTDSADLRTTLCLHAARELLHEAIELRSQPASYSASALGERRSPLSTTTNLQEEAHDHHSRR